MSLIYIITTLAVTAWLAWSVERRLRQQAFSVVWRVTAVALYLAGATLGIWLLTREYFITPTIRIVGYPFPVNGYVFIEGRWLGDRVFPQFVWLGVLADIAAGVSMCVLPLLVAQFIVERRFKHETTHNGSSMARFWVARQYHALMKTIAPTVFLVSTCALFLALWILSYFSYGLVAYEAYSGIGTELASVRGLVVFYSFDSYTDGHPPESWSCGFQEPASRSGQRLREDFDVWSGPHWWCRLGVFFLSTDTAFTGHTKVRLVAIPYWLPFSIVSIAACLGCRRRRRSKLPTINEPALPPNSA